MAGRSKIRQRREQREALAHRERDLRRHLEAIYSEQFTTFDALRTHMVQNGIVEHGLNPYDVIQRAIDDTATDYLLLRRKIDQDTHGDPDQLEDHPLYDFHERIREAMVRYSTFAMQYDIQKRQLRLSEVRVALLANTLRTVLQNLAIPPDTIKQIPRMLIEQLQLEQQERSNNPYKGGRPQAMDAHKAEALAEILHHDAEVTIEPDEDTASQNGHQPRS